MFILLHLNSYLRFKSHIPPENHSQLSSEKCWGNYSFNTQEWHLLEKEESFFLKLQNMNINQQLHKHQAKTEIKPTDIVHLGYSKMLKVELGSQIMIMYWVFVKTIMFLIHRSIVYKQKVNN